MWWLGCDSEHQRISVVKERTSRPQLTMAKCNLEVARRWKRLLRQPDSVEKSNTTNKTSKSKM